MKFWATASRARKAGSWAAVMALVLWLGMIALAVSPQLHRLLHADAQEPTHECLVTQIQHHWFLASLVAVTAPVAPSAGLELICRSDFQFLLSWDYRLSPSRGPPSASFFGLA